MVFSKHINLVESWDLYVALLDWHLRSGDSVHAVFDINPTYEPEMKGRDTGMPSPNPENTRTFSVLQRYNRLNLLVPVGVSHMWNAAMESKACRLTALGEHYRRLVEKGRL